MLYCQDQTLIDNLVGENLSGSRRMHVKIRNCAAWRKFIFRKQVLN